MNISSYLKTISKMEYLVLAVFIIYIIFPVKTPYQFAYYIDHPLGIVLVFIIAFYLFFYTTPLLGILFLFVAYELFRRSSTIIARVPIIQYTPTEEKRQTEMILMNSPDFKTLEEEIVAQRAPVDVSKSLYNETTFKPVYDRVNNASLI